MAMRITPNELEEDGKQFCETVAKHLHARLREIIDNKIFPKNEEGCQKDNVF